MASILLQRTRPAFTLGLSLTSALTAHTLLFSSAAASPSRTIRCDAPALQSTVRSYARDARNPVVTESGRVNPRVFSQISSGSIAGVLGGVAVSIFSKPLAIIFGLLVLGVQALESRGLHIVPYAKIQRTLGRAVSEQRWKDNVAFKVSFGVTFALAGFASFASD